MKTTRNTLFMKYPSSWWHDLWREGLVSGNGVLGINSYGGVMKETVILNHHDLWHGKSCSPLPDVSNAFMELREKMDAGYFKAASTAITDALTDKNYDGNLEFPLPLADLNVHYDFGNGFSDYIRWIQMDTGETGFSWKDNGSEFISEQFVSRPDNMVIKKISSTKELLNVSFFLDMHKNDIGQIDEEACGHILNSKVNDVEAPCLTYYARNDDGSCYGAVLRISAPGGKTEPYKGGIKASGCRDITVYLKVFVKCEEGNVDGMIHQIKGELQQYRDEYSTYLNRHKEEHGKIFGSASLELDYGNFHCNEELLLEAFQGRASPELIEKLWRFGRYLFISGSGPDSNPFPLYGLWGGDYSLMWSHNMANINIQMMYWHSFTGNLLDYNKAFIKYFNSKMNVFRENAKKLFGLNGIYLTAGTTPNMSYPTQIVPVIVNWVSTAAWLAQHYYNYYLYTNDKEYLKEEILPFMDESARFLEEFISYFPDGTIKVYPSVSPENTPGNFMLGAEEHTGDLLMPTTINSTIDLAIIKELFQNMCRLARQEGMFSDRLPVWEKILDSIGEYKISKDGGIREWQDDHFEERYEHRHLSHIYPLFPGSEVNTVDNSKLIPAFRKAVELRKIDTSSGWSLAYMANVFARLDDGNSAMESLGNLVKSTLISNFFTLHNDWRRMNVSLDWDPSPVQLDANMGYVNAIQEMLLYTSPTALKILPALPACMPKGKVHSLRYVNGFVDIEWNMEAQSFCCMITAVRGHKVKIQLFKNQHLPNCFSLSGKKVTTSLEGNHIAAEFKTGGRLNIGWNPDKGVL